MQVTPVMVGAVLLIVILGMLDQIQAGATSRLLMFYTILFLATGFIFFGFYMHLMALGYPESPFNRHNSPVFMILACGGVLAWAAYRLLGAGMTIPAILYVLLSLLIPILSLARGISRNRRGPE